MANEEQRPIEQEGVVPPPEPVTQTTEAESIPPTPVEAATQRLESAPQETVKEEAVYTVDMDGRRESVTKDEYDYLAGVGAKALVAAQYQRQDAERAAQEEAKPYPEAEEYTPPADHNSELKQRLSNLENNLYSQQVSGHQDKIKAEVEAKISASDTFQAAFQLEEGDKLQREVRKEIYNRAVQEQITAIDAFTAVERKWAELLGQERSGKLLIKLRLSSQAVADTGGGYAAPEEPMDANSWTTGQLLQSVSERLTNTDS